MASPGAFAFCESAVGSRQEGQPKATPQFGWETLLPNNRCLPGAIQARFQEIVQVGSAEVLFTLFFLNVL